MMPTWLIVALVVLWVSVPAVGLWLGIRQVRREIAAEDAAALSEPYEVVRELSRGRAIVRDHPRYHKRTTPRGVGRHDWPL